VTVPPADLECRALIKRFGGHLAVDQVSFAIPRGSFFSILGPSGCGKTTLLRMLAGFARPDSGDILIKGASVLDTPPNRRPVNLVFQHLALFPMMSVFENIAFGLRRRRRPESEIRAAVARVLERVGLPEAGPKRIDQLSGGQKQRIAIARCMVLDPAVLLLDEPLGALDLKLREAMQEELKALQQALGITFIFVTHDQGEALSMADRVAVFNEGRIVQEGSPQDIYERPRTRFVADFVGSANVLSPELSVRAGGPEQWASLRAEVVSVTAPDAGRLAGVVRSVRYLGAANRVTVAVPEGDLTASIPAGRRLPTPGETVGLDWSGDDLHAMDGGS
jgi:ABC-type Fe3+/spermidine/putrescine transport system ATPase subunit